MAKSIRTIKADLRRDEHLGGVSRDARYLFVLLITYADDHGRFRAHPALLASELYPYDDDAGRREVEQWLDELCEAGRVRKYTSGGQEYGYIVNWAKHQRVDNAARSELPDPTECEISVPNLTERRDRRTAANLGEPPLERKGEDRKGEDLLRGELETSTDPDPSPVAPVGADRQSKPRERNLIWDALTDAFGEAQTRTEQKLRGQVARSLASAGATPAEIATRVIEHRRRWPGVSCTETSLEKHWTKLGEVREPMTHRERMAARRAAGQ